MYRASTWFDPSCRYGLDSKGLDAIWYIYFVLATPPGAVTETMTFVSNNPFKSELRKVRPLHTFFPSTITTTAQHTVVAPPISTNSPQCRKCSRRRNAIAVKDRTSLWLRGSDSSAEVYMYGGNSNITGAWLDLYRYQLSKTAPTLLIVTTSKS